MAPYKNMIVLLSLINSNTIIFVVESRMLLCVYPIAKKMQQH